MDPGTDLPAPYRSPWRSLAEALTAVAAAVRLKLRELWRRNRQGDLPRPRFWPQALAPLFWPGLLILVLLPLTLLATPARPPWPGIAAAPPASPPAADPTAELSAATRGLPLPPPPEAGSMPAGAGPASASGSDVRDEAAATTAAAAGGPPIAPAAAPDATTVDLRLDPLLELLVDDADRQLLQAASPDPGSGLLSLRLSERASALTGPALLERAQRWQQRAGEAGYERLELVDASGALLARQALVGSGMILLAPGPQP